MKVFAISDLHLSVNNPKPMDIFGPTWEGYLEKIIEDWKSKVTDDDLVLMSGDFSWAMKLDQTKEDFEIIKSLPGKKILIRGNHDYWWASISAVRQAVPENVYAIQNDALKFGEYIICGTRLWNLPDGKPQTPEDEKIYKRELIRLEMTLQSAQKLKTGDEKIICMLHYPPYTFKEEDNEITEMLEKYNVYKVVYGHIHAYRKQSLELEKNGILYYLTSCDLVENKLIEID